MIQCHTVVCWELNTQNHKPPNIPTTCTCAGTRIEFSKPQIWQCLYNVVTAHTWGLHFHEVCGWLNMHTYVIKTCNSVIYVVSQLHSFWNIPELCGVLSFRQYKCVRIQNSVIQLANILCTPTYIHICTPTYINICTPTPAHIQTHIYSGVAAPKKWVLYYEWICVGSKIGSIYLLIARQKG